MLPLTSAVGRTLLLAGLLLLLVGQPATAQEPGGTVDVVEVVGVLDGPLTDFLVDSIEEADASGAEAVVVRLDSAGALRGDVDRIVETIQASEVPVVVYVGTPGAVAAGAAVTVAHAAHVLALAPVTVYGAADPQDLGEEGEPERTAERLAALATERGRSTDFARAAALDGAVVIAVNEGEGGQEPAEGTAYPPQADPSTARTLDQQALVDEGIAEIVAGQLTEVLYALDGREVSTAAGTRQLEIDPATANVRFVNPDLLTRILHTASGPTLAYLLLLAGALTLAFEIFQPGFGVAGFSALLVLALGIYATVVLPVNAWAGVLALVGLLLLAYDLAIAGLSWPTAVGTLALGAGSWWLFPVAALSPPKWLVVAGTAFSAVFFVFIMTTVLRAQGNQAQRGAEHVIGKTGVVRSMLNPEGHIYVDGALWRARAPEDAGKVKVGTPIRVLGLNDKLTLDVEILTADEHSAV